jgi:hypothetical protein
MKAAAVFAAAYGFPPSLCRNPEEALGLFQNIRFAMAIRSAIQARGVGVCFSQDANAELMKDCGAHPRDVARMKLDAMRQRGASE